MGGGDAMQFCFSAHYGEYMFPRRKPLRSQLPKDANAGVHKDGFGSAMPYAKWSVYEVIAVCYIYIYIYTSVLNPVQMAVNVVPFG